MDLILLIIWIICMGALVGVASHMLGHAMRPKRKLPAPPMSADELYRVARAFDTLLNRRR